MHVRIRGLKSSCVVLPAAGRDGGSCATGSCTRMRSDGQLPGEVAMLVAGPIVTTRSAHSMIIISTSASAVQSYE